MDVAHWYRALATTFVLDPADTVDRPAVEALELETVVAAGRLTEVCGLQETIGALLPSGSETPA